MAVIGCLHDQLGISGSLKSDYAGPYRGGNVFCGYISQIADHRIAKADETLSVGEEVDAKIIDINDEKKKVSLSIRALLTGEGDED